MEWRSNPFILSSDSFKFFIRNASFKPSASSLFRPRRFALTASGGVFLFLFAVFGSN